jgi:anti-sigma regulatory factor (Ser/Thr protein kinase)
MMAGDRGQRATGHGPTGDGPTGHGPTGGLPSGPAVLEQDFDAGSLYALRSAVAAHAAAAGLPPGRVYDVVAAAHEMAANAVRHGAGHGRLRLQAADGVLTCQVSDDGPAAAVGDENHGAAPGAPWPSEHGHGLWVIERVADQFTVDRGPSVTTATVIFTLRGGAVQDGSLHSGS